MPQDKLIEELAQEEARLAALDREREEVRTRMDALRRELSKAPVPITATAHPPLLATTSVPTTPIEKVRLFRSLKLVRSKGKAKATVAAARKLCCYLYWCLKEDWNYEEWLRQHDKLAVRPRQALGSAA